MKQTIKTNTYTANSSKFIILDLNVINLKSLHKNLKQEPEVQLIERRRGLNATKSCTYRYNAF